MWEGARGMFSAVIVCITDFVLFLNPVCLFIIINLNTLDSALMPFLHVIFKLLLAVGS